MATRSARDLLCVEAPPPARRATLSMLERHAVRARACSTAAEARELAARSSWGGVIIARRLPDAGGLDLLEALRRRQPHLPAMLTTTVVSASLTNRCASLGAHLAVRPHTPAVFRAFLEQVARSASPSTWPDVPTLLAEVRCTTRESELIRLALGRRNTHAEIAAAMGITRNTVKALVGKVLRKTGAPSLAVLRARVHHVHILAQ